MATYKITSEDEFNTKIGGLEQKIIQLENDVLELRSDLLGDIPAPGATVLHPGDDIQAAVNAGGTIVLEDGTYDPFKVISGTHIKARNPGKAIISGAVDFSGGWQKDGEYWRKEFAEPLHQHPAHSVHSVSGAPSARGMAHRRAQQPHMLIHDGVPLYTVYSKDELQPGTFYLEGTAAEPVAFYAWFEQDGSAPKSEVFTVYDQHLISGVTDDVDNVTLDGLALLYCANTGVQGALHLPAGSDNWTVRNCIVKWSNSEGVHVSGAGHTFENVIANNHGQCGFAGYGMRHCRFIRCEGSYNVWKRGIDPKWHAGNKFSNSNNNYFEDFTSIGNDGPGLWFDIYNFDNEVKNFMVDNALAFGVHIEHHTQGTERGSAKLTDGIIKRTRKFDGIGSGLQIQGAVKNYLFKNIELTDNADGAVYYKKREERGYSGFNTFDNIRYSNNGENNRWAVQGPLDNMPDMYLNMTTPTFANWP